MKKKLLFVTPTLSPYRAEFLYELSKYFDITVINEINSKVNKHRNPEWFERCKQVNLNIINLDEKKIKPIWWIRTEISKVLKKGFDFIIMGGYSTNTQMFAIEYMKFKKIPFILSTDGGFIKNDNFIKRAIKTHYISSANIWLSTSKKADEYLVYYGANQKKIYRYPFTSIQNKEVLNKNNVNKEKFKQELNIKEKKIITSVGRFTYKNGYGKGFDLILQLAERINSDIGVYIIGDEPTSEFVELKKNKNLDNVHFISFQNKENLEKYYLASDLFVLMTREDVWGLVINEAMANGLPIITTDKCIAGLELVEDDINGYIIPVDNVELLTEKCNLILENDDLSRKMSIASLEKIKEYTIENMALEHNNILNSIKL